MPTQWFTGVITTITELAPKVRSFALQVKDVKQFEFRAGQFITFDLPIGEKRLQRWRSYSIASAPTDSNLIELCIVHYENGLGSSYFFNEVMVGTELKFKGPEGGFYLPEIIEHDIILICTGTGIAPFRSMLHDIQNKNKHHKNIHLVFGTRKQEDVLYFKELQHFEHTLKGFKFDIALSREEPPSDDPHFHSGYVHPIYLKTYSAKRQDIIFYICGWSKMIDEAVENLFGELQYDRTQIIYELYG